jgi:hypothetical protein
MVADTMAGKLVKTVAERLSGGLGSRRFRPIGTSRDSARQSADVAAELPTGQFDLGRIQLDGPARPARLRDVFTPTQPKGLGPHFVGRERYLSRLVSAVEEERTHVVLFGERGRGKTSLAAACAHLATEAGYLVVRRSCGTTTSFEELFRSIFSAIRSDLLSPSPHANLPTAEDLLPKGSFGAATVVEILQGIRGQRLIFVIDEVDRIRDDAVRNTIAETIKGLSDAKIPVTLLLVGVAESLENVLGQHPSIERNVLGLHLRRMTPKEIRQMIISGAKAVGLRFTEPVISAIQSCSRGMPYYTQLLCLYAGNAAVKRGVVEVGTGDFLSAVDDVLMKQEQEVGGAYNVVCGRNRGAERILLCAALAAVDEHDRFDATAMLTVSENSSEFPALSAAEIERGLGELAGAPSPPLITHQDPQGGRYSFVKETLAHYVLLRHAALERQNVQNGADHA